METRGKWVVRIAVLTGLFLFAIPSIYCYGLAVATSLWRQYPLIPRASVIRGILSQLIVMFRSALLLERRPSNIDVSFLFAADGFLYLWPLMVLISVSIIVHPAVERLCRVLFRRAYLVALLPPMVVGVILSFAFASAHVGWNLLTWWGIYSAAVVIALRERLPDVLTVLRLGLVTLARGLAYQIVGFVAINLASYPFFYMIVIPGTTVGKHGADTSVQEIMRRTPELFVRLIEVMLSVVTLFPVLWVTLHMVLGFIVLPRLALEHTLASPRLGR